MAIKDPDKHLDEELDPDTAHDKGTYREFVKSGDKVASNVNIHMLLRIPTYTAE
jgi:hypothetical protein